MAENPGSGTASGGLGSDALMELWCWLWAGVAEREQRIWREASSSRDARREKQVCLDLQELLLDRIPVPADDGYEKVPYIRLSSHMDPAAASAFRDELEAMRDRARAHASGNEVGGNFDDAMALVLKHFRPLVSRLRTSPRPSDPAPAGALGPVQAFRFHAWLAALIDLLEAGAADEGFERREPWREAIPFMRRVLGQWIASLPPSDGSGHYFHATWNRLAQGVAAEPFRKFAEWLAWQARPDSGAPAAARENLALALRMLAKAAGCPEEQLRPAGPDPAPPWDPPGTLQRALLGGAGGASFTATLVENTPGEDRAAVPLHQFLASLDRGGSPPPVGVRPRPPSTWEPPPDLHGAVCYIDDKEVWREGEVLREGELQERIVRAIQGLDPKPPPSRPRPAASKTRPATEARPVAAAPPPRPAPPRLEPPPPPPQPLPEKERDWSDRVILSHPRLHRAIERIMLVGGGAFFLGLPYAFTYGKWNLSIPYVGETLTALSCAGFLAAFLLPTDAEGRPMLAPPPPRRG